MPKPLVIGLTLLCLLCAVFWIFASNGDDTQKDEPAAEKPTFQRAQVQRGGAKEY
jgi:hypothetical protein